MSSQKISMTSRILRLFYTDQLGPGKMFLSEEVAQEYDEVRVIRIAQHVEAEQSFEAEIRYIFDAENDADHIEASTSTSGLSVRTDLTVNMSRGGLIK